MVREELLDDLKNWVTDCRTRRGLLTINGLVKTGKTTVLTGLLPQIILQKFPDAWICVLNFDAFLPKKSESGEMEERLRKRVADWALSIGVQSRAETLDGLVDELQKSDQRIFFLIDEVQRFFEVKGGTIPNWVALKGFMCVSLEVSNLHFAITGSAMVLAWQNLLKLPPNGFTFAGESRSVFLPSQNDRHEVEYFFQRCQDIEDLSELVGGLSCVPLMAYTVRTRREVRSIEDARQAVTSKLRSEFESEMVCLLQDQQRTSPQTCPYILELARGTATADPSMKLGELYSRFFQPYIVKDRNSFAFVESPWRTFLLSCVSEDGDVIPQSPQFLLFRRFQVEMIMQQLADVGEKVSGAARRGTPTDIQQDVEDICRRHEEAHGWPQPDEQRFAWLLGKNNDGVNQSIQRSGYIFPGCTYLRMLRNTWCHRNRGQMPLPDWEYYIFNCLPPAPGRLLRALRDYTFLPMEGD